MMSNPETVAGYVDSEYSDIESADVSYAIRGSSPKFGNETIQSRIGNGFAHLLSERTRLDAGDSTIKVKQPYFSPCLSFNDETDKVSSANTSLYGHDNAMKHEKQWDCGYNSGMGNEFTWWCDEQCVSDCSVSNTAESTTPITENNDTGLYGKKLFNDSASTEYELQQQLSDRTRCGSTSSEEESAYVSNSISADMSSTLSSTKEWSSFMKPADHTQEVERLKEQILYRLGLKLAVNPPAADVTKGYTQTCDAAVQTCEDSTNYEYREYELKWLRDMNEALAIKLIEMVNCGKSMAYKTEEDFIKCLQSHLRKTQEEIDRLLHLQPSVQHDANSDTDDLLEEIEMLKAENYKLKGEIHSLETILRESRENPSLSERAKILEQKLVEEKTSKKVLMDDFTKTLSYMRVMKDRLKTLSHERKDKSHPKHEANVQKPTSRMIEAMNGKSNVKQAALKGCIKRSNTTNCVPNKTERVKFAETSDVYYLPKRSYSEMGPFVADTSKTLPILPCKIRPPDEKVPLENRGGLIGFFKNIKNNITGSTKTNQAKINVLKVPQNQELQTRQQIDNYKKRLHSRGLV